MRHLRIELSSGPLEMGFPDHLTPDDVEDIEATFAIAFRVMKRIAGCDGHASDCAIHNGPALPVGPCDCK